jgi:hypothetical protein
MELFLERFVLPLLVFGATTVIIVNPMKLDWHQRVSILIIVVASAYLIGYSLHKARTAPTPTVTVPSSAPEAPKTTGDAVTSGSQSPAITGAGNSVNYGDAAPSKGTKRPPHKGGKQ